MKKILAMGSHFDDIEIGCAGTLLQHVNNGDKIFLSILNANEKKTGSVEERFEEQKSSMIELGVDFNNLMIFNLEFLFVPNYKNKFYCK